MHHADPNQLKGTPLLIMKSVSQRKLNLTALALCELTPSQPKKRDEKKNSPFSHSRSINQSIHHVGWSCVKSNTYLSAAVKTNKVNCFLLK